VEIYDENKEDCLGWITIMEKCDEMNLRKRLKKEDLDLTERKKIAIGIQAGFQYLEDVKIFHYDRKLANFLLIGDVAKICDFGLVTSIGGQGFGKLGYTRRGAKYNNFDSAALCNICNSNYFYLHFSCRNAGICDRDAAWQTGLK